ARRPAPGLRVTDMAFHGAAGHYPLNLVVIPTGGLLLLFDYRPDRFERIDVQEIAAELRLILEAFAADPRQTVGEIGIGRRRAGSSPATPAPETTARDDAETADQPKTDPQLAEGGARR